jgi:type IV secretory pathway VirB2 component (pilin)
MQKVTNTKRISATRIAKAILPYGVMLAFAVAANAQTGSLNGISATVNTFVTWLRLLAGTLGVAAIVWGGINMYFSDLGRGMAKVVAGLVGLIIAGYAQSIVDTFFTTTS